MTPINIIALAFSVWRITEIVTSQDGPFGLFKALRVRFKVFGCPFCFSVWASLLGLLLYRYWQPGNYLFALSWSYGLSSLLAARLAAWAGVKKKEAVRELLIGQSSDGQVSVIRSDFTATEHLHVFQGFLSNLNRNIPDKENATLN